MPWTHSLPCSVWRTTWHPCHHMLPCGLLNATAKGQLGLTPVIPLARSTPALVILAVISTTGKAVYHSNAVYIGLLKHAVPVHFTISHGAVGCRPFFDLRTCCAFAHVSNVARHYHHALRCGAEPIGEGCNPFLLFIAQHLMSYAIVFAGISKTPV